MRKSIRKMYTYVANNLITVAIYTAISRKVVGKKCARDNPRK